MLTQMAQVKLNGSASKPKSYKTKEVGGTDAEGLLIGTRGGKVMAKRRE